MSDRAIDGSNPFVRAVAEVGRSVLTVRQLRRRGSAAVWDAKAGLAVTTYQTVGAEESVELGLPDGQRRSAEVIGTDPATDLALLRTDPAGLVQLDRAADELPLGAVVVALARPGHNLRASLRMVGLVAGQQRTPLGGRIDRYIETDRALPGGFSGGPLIDHRGAVHGINTAGLIRGADLVLPVAMVDRVVTELAAHGTIKRGYLGIAVQRAHLPAQLAASLGQKTGALIVRVDPGSPAEQSGLFMGDTLVAVAGQPVGGPDGLRELLADRQGTTAEATIVRLGATETLPLAIGEA